MRSGGRLGTGWYGTERVEKGGPLAGSLPPWSSGSRVASGPAETSDQVGSWNTEFLVLRSMGLHPEDGRTWREHFQLE